MGLAPAWIVRVRVPIGARSRRRPLSEVRAVLAVVRDHPIAGTLGKYRDVMHLSLALERFTHDGSSRLFRVPVVTVTTYVHGVTRFDVEDLARAIAAVHPWEHPVIECTGPDGTFLWSPES